jgi:hypothetical protein
MASKEEIASYFSTGQGKAFCTFDDPALIRIRTEEDPVA